MSMPRGLVMLSLLTAFPTWGGDPPNDLLRALQAIPFQRVDRLEGLPEPVRGAIHDQVKITFANPGENWNATDMIFDGNHPSRRLIFAGASPTLWFLYYEHGGRGRHDDLLVTGRTTEGGYWIRWMDCPFHSAEKVGMETLIRYAGKGNLKSSEHGKDQEGGYSTGRLSSY